MRVLHITWIMILNLIIVGCKSIDSKKADEAVNVPETVANQVFTVKITGNEQDSLVTAYILLQNENAGQIAGNPLPAGMEIYIDDMLFQEDSARMTGVYYEINTPATQFTGNHKLVFKQGGNVVYELDFQYEPLLLQAPIPQPLPKGDFNIAVKVEQQTPVRIFLTDTSITGREVNRLDTIRNGQFMLRDGDMAMLASGPVQAQFSTEQEIPFQSRHLKGRIEISYRLSRALVLQ